MAIDGGMNFGNSTSDKKVKKQPKREPKKVNKNRNDFSSSDDVKVKKEKNPKLVWGLGIAMVVLAVGAILVLTFSLLPSADRDKPYPKNEPLDSGSDVAHVDGSEANAPSAAPEGFIDTGSGYGYRIAQIDTSSDEIKIVGAIKNLGDKAQNSVSIDFFLYNENKELIGTAAAGTDNIDAGAVWEFNATSVDKIKTSDVASFLIDEIQWGSADVTSAAVNAEKKNEASESSNKSADASKEAAPAGE